MKNKEILVIVIALLIQVFLPMWTFAEDEYVSFDEYPIESYGYETFIDSFGGFEDFYFRVNPANSEEAVIFDLANEDPLLETLSCYDRENFETPRIVTIDGKQLIPTIIDDRTAIYGFGFENVKITSNIRHISKYSFQDSQAKNVIFEEGLTSIGERCFSNFNCITELILPNSLYSISNDAFTYAGNLEKITFGKGLYKVGDYSFSNNAKLTEIELPENLHRLGKGAFDNCTNLKKVRIPRWIKQCSYNFNNCPNIEVIDLYCESDVFVFTSSFQNVDKEKCIVIVPKGRSAWFRKYSTFHDFKNIIERDDELVTTVVDTLESAPESNVESFPESARSDSEEVYSLSGVKYGSVDNVPSNEIYIVTNHAGSSQKKIKQ